MNGTTENSLNRFSLPIFLLFFFLFALNSYSLPKCEGGEPLKWDKCVGSFTFPGGKYVGEWQNGTYHGRGAYIVTDGPYKGDKYVGEFKDNKRHGKGTYISADGIQYEGIWKNGEFVESMDI